MGFELDRQKTEKPTSLNICCWRATQLLTKNPPDRVVMIVSIKFVGPIYIDKYEKDTYLLEK